MPKFTVSFEITTYESVEVEAETLDEALEIAEPTLANLAENVSCAEVTVVYDESDKLVWNL